MSGVDHTSLSVSDFAKAKAFYSAALKPLGVTVLMEFPKAMTGNVDVAGLGSNGKPFFWLADTAWELIHSTTREEARYYLRTRAQQGFTVIQAVVLAEMDGINKPTPEGLFQHYRAIAESVGLPIVVYNVPGRTGCNVDPATLVRLSTIPCPICCLVVYEMADIGGWETDELGG